MIGFRGTSRYYALRYRDGFALECRALRHLREVIGMKNIFAMIPFCRSIREADRVLEVMAQERLKRSEDGLRVYVMCEIPSNVVLAKAFAERFDGFSMGSNDLNELTLGVDRDSEELADLFDEQDKAVKWIIRTVVKAAHTYGGGKGRPMRTGAKRSPGICGVSGGMRHRLRFDQPRQSRRGKAARGHRRAAPVGIGPVIRLT